MSPDWGLPVHGELRRASQSPIWGVARITQQFGDPDFYWSTRDPAKAKLGHRAMDIGFGRCNDPILAMASGSAIRIQDNAKALGAKSNALGVRIDHGGGWTSEYWHLGSWSIPVSAAVKKGQEIGKVGDTGLGAVCHCHIEIKHNGNRVDPELYIFAKQGGVVSKPPEEDDVYAAWLPQIQWENVRPGIVSQGATAYKAPAKDPALKHYTFMRGAVSQAMTDRTVEVLGYLKDPQGFAPGLWWVCRRGGGHRGALFLVANSEMDNPNVDNQPGRVVADCSEAVAMAAAEARAATNQQWREWLGKSPAAAA